MKKFILPFFLISVIANAEDCNTPLPLENQSIMGLAEIKCFSEDLSKNDIDRQLTKIKTTKNFCKSCNNHLYRLSLNSPETKEENNLKFAKTTLTELQKELSFITTDLMKLRSSFTLKFDPSTAIKSCNFTNLPRPSCLSSDNAKKTQSLLEAEILKTQNIVATELAHLISSDSESDEGLFKRTKVLQCSIQDSELMFSQMRYNETLLVPEIITELKKLNLQEGQSIEKTIIEKKLKTDQLLTVTKSLATHPLIKSLFDHPEELKVFLNSINPADSNETIIEKLYSSNVGKNFGNSITQRCDSALKTTASILEKIYCDQESPYVAENAKTMELINGNKFKNLSDEIAETNIQKYCAQINESNESEEKKKTSFEEVLKINEKNDPTISQFPIEIFREEAYSSLLGNEKQSVCSAKSRRPPCSPESNEKDCQLLFFIEQSRASDTYKKIANSSDENINSILRSLIGNGMPVKNGKVDQNAVTLLKKEGILPAPDLSPRPTEPRDASSFYRTITKTKEGQKSKQYPTTISQDKPFSNEDKETQSNYFPKNEIDESGKFSRAQKESGIGQNIPFSNLSDEEQRKLMSYLGKKKTQIQKTKNSESNRNKASEEGNGNEESILKNDNVMAETGPAPSRSESLVPSSLINRSPSSISKTKSFSIPKKDLMNQALLDANNFKKLPKTERPTDSFLLTKSKEGKNEIQINVGEDELAKIQDFKKKLEDLLAFHGEELSFVKDGEKLVVKLNNFHIDVFFNKHLNTYEASCKDQNIPKEYLKTISHYFNVTLKEVVGRRKDIVNNLKLTQNTLKSK